MVNISAKIRQKREAEGLKSHYKLYTVRDAADPSTLSIVEEVWLDVCCLIYHLFALAILGRRQSIANSLSQSETAITLEFCKHGLAPYLEGELEIRSGLNIETDSNKGYTGEISTTAVDKLREPEGELAEVILIPYLNPCYTPKFLDSSQALQMARELHNSSTSSGRTS